MINTRTKIFRVGEYKSDHPQWNRDYPIGKEDFYDPEIKAYGDFDDWRARSGWCLSPLGHIGEECVFCGYKK